MRWYGLFLEEAASLLLHQQSSLQTHQLTSFPPPPPFCFISSLSCSVSPFTFLPSDPFFWIPRKRLWNWAVLYLYSSSSSSSFSEHTIYIHSDMYSLREPILCSPVSACLYLRLRQIIVAAQEGLTLVCSIYIEIKHGIFCCHNQSIFSSIAPN